MVTLNKIYTRTGDAGDTALGDGTRVSKASMRVAAYGTVDELNAVIGVARLAAAMPLATMLGIIQNDLFDLGADLCVPQSGDAEDPGERLRVTAGQVKRLEHEIDDANRDLKPLKSFILPGGTPLAASLHQCRTVARRAERHTVELADHETVNPEAVRYLNRLSDWFFVMARVANSHGKSDVLWIPGAGREDG